jgi:hypothetical protein
MPRPINYITKLRQWARETHGDEGLRLALLFTISKFVKGKTRVEEVNKMVAAYSKSIKESQKEEELTDEMLEEYLAGEMEN